MTSRTRFWLMGLLVCAGACASVGSPAAFGAGFGVESFFAANCKVATCEKAANPSEEKKKAEEEGYSQAAGHPPYGVTDFKLKRVEASPGLFVPAENVKEFRIDVAPGVSTSPEAVPKCKVTESGFLGKEVESKHHLFSAPNCPPESVIGENKVTTVLEVSPGVFADVPLKGNVYNLEQQPGLSSYFGIALEIAPGVVAHTFIEGHVEWATDYHDYFEIKNVTQGLLESRLVFFGNHGTGGFLTNPSNCAGPGPLTTSEWHGVAYEGESAASSYTTPIGTEGCKGEKGLEIPPFEPGFKMITETLQSDQPTGVATEATLNHSSSPTALDNSQLQSATVTLPEGMTLSPSAARGLAACSLTQFAIGTRNAVACPSASQIGSATLTVPQLPTSEPLQGAIYLGDGPTVTGPPYEMYVDAESARYGVTVRLRGIVKPNPITGQLTAEFTDSPGSGVKLPEQPFSNLTLSFNGGPLAPLANPLTCGPATTTASFAPYTGSLASVSLVSSLTVDSDGKGGACPTPLPFALTQSTENVPAGGGHASNFTLHLKREDGQQYLSSVSAMLPPGLVGKIPVVPLCPEPAASTGNCPANSQIGTVATTVGSGKSPINFNGKVYLTGPTGKGPFGMTIVVAAEFGAFSLGNVVSRAAIEIDPHTARVTVNGAVPTIWAGIPLRLKELVVAINRQNFLVNPTNCATLATETTLGAQQGATEKVSTPYQATGCSSLAFKPKFGAATGGKSSRANGTSLITKLNFHPKGPEANVRSVVVSLPKALPSRLSTLNHACTEAVFNANPGNCPADSRVGTARVKTPTLPGQLSGPAYFVSHGGAKFPDLDLVLSGDGVTVILVGNTNINEKTNITTTSFISPPDVPFTGFELNLPAGPNSAVGANGNLCKQSLVMPTTITAQNGKVVRQNVRMAVTGCPVTVISRYTKNRQAVVTVRAPSAGRVSGRGTHLGTRFKHPGRAKSVTLRLPITKAVGHRSIRVRIGFIPKNKRERSSVAHTTVRF